MAVPASELRTYMLAAYDKDMVSGDYVFMDVDNLRDTNWKHGNETWVGNDGRDNEARIAAETLLIVS